MREVVVLLLHLIVTVARRARPGGIGSVVAESILVKPQRLILNGGRKRAPHRRAPDRILAGWCTLFIRRVRVFRSATVLRPSPLVRLHDLLGKPKYRMLFSPKGGRRPGPKGPSQDLLDAIVAMKQRNRTWGCPHIAPHIGLAFGVEIDQDVVRRIWSIPYRPKPNSEGPSWLTFLGHAKDRLGSCDLFRCESAPLRTYWVRVVMDQFTRRVIGFGVPPGTVDGPALSRMFRRAIRGARSAKVPQCGSGSAGSIPSRASQSSSPGSDGSPNGSLRAAGTSVGRAAERHDSAGILRSDSSLEHRRSGGQADRFSTLLSCSSNTLRIGGTIAGSG